MAVAPTPLRSRRSPRRLELTLAVALILALAVIGLLLARYEVFGDSSISSGVQGSGVAATQTRVLPRFDGVELAGSNNVTIRVGVKQAVVVHADDNLLGYITTRVRDGSLVVGNSPGSYTTKSPMHVEVGVPSLEALKLTGSGLVAVTGVKASLLTVRLSGSGVLRASGTAARLDVILAGSGDAQLEELVAREVHAVVSGSGRIFVTATERLNASVPGSGVVVYGGDPRRVTTNVTGSGVVLRG